MVNSHNTRQINWYHQTQSHPNMIQRGKTSNKNITVPQNIQHNSVLAQELILYPYLSSPKFMLSRKAFLPKPTQFLQNYSQWVLDTERNRFVSSILMCKTKIMEKDTTQNDRFMQDKTKDGRWLTVQNTEFICEHSCMGQNWKTNFRINNPVKTISLSPLGHGKGHQSMKFTTNGCILNFLQATTPLVRKETQMKK